MSTLADLLILNLGARFTKLLVESWSCLFSGLLQDISVEAISKKEAGLLAKRVET